MTHRLRPHSMWGQMSDMENRETPRDAPWFGKQVLYVMEKPPRYDNLGRMVEEAAPCAVYDDLDRVIEQMHGMGDRAGRVYVLRLNEDPK